MGGRGSALTRCMGKRTIIEVEESQQERTEIQLPLEDLHSRLEECRRFMEEPKRIRVRAERNKLFVEACDAALEDAAETEPEVEDLKDLRPGPMMASARRYQQQYEAWKRKRRILKANIVSTKGEEYRVWEETQLKEQDVLHWCRGPARDRDEKILVDKYGKKWWD